MFEGHFPGHPILPGVLMIETMAQTGGWLVLAVLRFERMAFLAQVKEAKLRAFVVPGQAGCRPRRGCCTTAPATPWWPGGWRPTGEQVAEAEITYRVVPFPNADAARRRCCEAARRVGVPEELLHVA